MPCFRQTSAADSPAACSFSTLMICSSVNLLLRMSVSRRNGLYPNSGTSTGSRSHIIVDRKHELIKQEKGPRGQTRPPPNGNRQLNVRDRLGALLPCGH